jgi:hypothetical protein
MFALRTVAAAAGLWTCFSVSPASAQIDYRNLDDDRPVTTEDAYPVEHHAFELLAPYRFEREQGGVRSHLFPLEVEYGVMDNTQIGIKAPIAGFDAGPTADTDWGLAGLGAFALYNFNTESPTLPALSIRADLSLPVGSLAGNAARFGLKAIATRSWGLYRLHFNVLRSFGSEDDPPAVEGLARSSYSLAVDRTLFRQSVLLVAEVSAAQVVRSTPTQVNAALGARYQWSPTLVLDLGVARRLRQETGPDFALTVGLSHAFGLGWLRPGRP